jgi:hypothetical protein
MSETSYGKSRYLSVNWEFSKINYHKTFRKTIQKSIIKRSIQKTFSEKQYLE